MILSRIYSNKPRVFSAIEFNTGLNVIVGEIRLPENRGKDTHNLGKSILARLVDFCFLSRKDKRHFLFKHYDQFSDFVFYLELKSSEGEFLTIRRSVQNATKISVKIHEEPNCDFSDLPDDAWTHLEVPFDRAKQLIDGLLNWSSISPWAYRMALGYQLRSQADYGDVFQLRKFASTHSTWKPFLARLLGFDEVLIGEGYEKEKDLDELRVEVARIRSEIGLIEIELEDVEGILFLKREEVQKRERNLKSFDFSFEDRKATDELVQRVSERLSALNKRRYRISQNLHRIERSLDINTVKFDVGAIRKLFDEVVSEFPGSLQKDFEDLVAFNKEITSERVEYLREERRDLVIRLEGVEKEIGRWQTERSKRLSGISQKDSFEKYREASRDLVSLLSEVKVLEAQKNRVDELKTKLRRLGELESEVEALHENIKESIDDSKNDQSSTFSEARRLYADFIESVLGRKALLKANVNKQGHLKFDAVILDPSGNATSADSGHTYKKLLCIAFDLVIARLYLGGRYPRFTYHDGVFESLDNRKKQALLEKLREYASLGLQVIVTSIDSDFPVGSQGDPWIDSDEVILRLHDQGAPGRLFKMSSW